MTFSGGGWYRSCSSVWPIAVLAHCRFPQELPAETERMLSHFESPAPASRNDGQMRKAVVFVYEAEYWQPRSEFCAACIAPSRSEPMRGVHDGQGRRFRRKGRYSWSFLLRGSVQN